MSEGQALVPSDANRQIDAFKRYSDAFVASGMFKDVRMTAQAFVKIQAGHELGLAPFAAMQGIHVVDGKPTLSATLIAALVRRSGKYDYRVQERTDEACTILFLMRERVGLLPDQVRWVELGTSRFSIEDASRASLRGKDNWKKYPRAMCYARAMSEGARVHCPDVFSGMAVYVEGEIDPDNDNTNVLDIEAVVEQPPVVSEPVKDGETSVIQEQANVNQPTDVREQVETPEAPVDTKRYDESGWRVDETEADKSDDSILGTEEVAAIVELAAKARVDIVPILKDLGAERLQDLTIAQGRVMWQRLSESYTRA